MLTSEMKVRKERWFILSSVSISVICEALGLADGKKKDDFCLRS